VSEALLSIRGLDVYYGAVHALKGVDIEVRRGEIVTLIGANGAGKSTLLRAISGLVRPRAGTISFDGKDLLQVAAHDIVVAGISHSPEGRAVFSNLSVEDNLTLGAYRRRDAQIGADMARMYGLFPRLGERKKQASGTMSGGEQQMLAIARALMSRPRLLLLDEPSLGLAPLLVTDIFRTIVEINHEGTTILLVEQNANQALRIAHRGYVLETGKVALADDAANLLSDPAVKEAYLGG
jgi:branched-chain amino acid transport system ATP-binding protein